MAARSQAAEKNEADGVACAGLLSNARLQPEREAVRSARVVDVVEGDVPEREANVSEYPSTSVVDHS